MFRSIQMALILLMLIPTLGFGQYDRSSNGPLKFKVFFDTSDFNLDERDYAVLQNIVKIVKAKPGILFEVSGHTDTSGTLKFNESLSLRRAIEVKNYLISQGLSDKNFHPVGYGETQPFAYRGKYNDKNSRRVEFKQILRVTGKLSDAQTGKPVLGKALLNIPGKPMMNQEVLCDKNGEFEFLTTFRKKYYFFGFAESYLTVSDSIQANLKEIGASNRHFDLKMTQVHIAERINFDNIYFYSTQFKVMPKSEPAILLIVEKLKANPTLYLEIRGHVNQPNRDKLDKEIIEDGYRLSFARSKAVYNELLRKGISPSRIKYRGMGSDEMKFPNPETDEENEANRRVEIVLLNIK